MKSNKLENQMHNSEFIGNEQDEKLACGSLEYETNLRNGNNESGWLIKEIL